MKEKILALISQVPCFQCGEPSTRVSAIHEHYEWDTPANKGNVIFHCDLHGLNISQSRSPEYVATCPCCYCDFGVNND